MPHKRERRSMKKFKLFLVLTLAGVCIVFFTSFAFAGPGTTAKSVETFKLDVMIKYFQDLRKDTINSAATQVEFIDQQIWRLQVNKQKLVADEAEKAASEATGAETEAKPEKKKK